MDGEGHAGSTKPLWPWISPPFFGLPQGLILEVSVSHECTRYYSSGYHPKLNGALHTYQSRSSSWLCKERFIKMSVGVRRSTHSLFYHSTLITLSTPSSYPLARSSTQFKKSDLPLPSPLQHIPAIKRQPSHDVSKSTSINTSKPGTAHKSLVAEHAYRKRGKAKESGAPNSGSENLTVSFVSATATMRDIPHVNHRPIRSRF